MIVIADRSRQGVPWESHVERKIREAQERGEFDDLPGAGRPLPDLDRPRDDLWWVKRLIRRENLSITPPVLQLRKEREEAVDRVRQARSESEVRSIVAEVNARIGDLNAMATIGPVSNVTPLDVEEVLRARRRG